MVDFYFSQVPPKVYPFHFPADSLNAGESLQLQCSLASGDVPIQITWSFHGSDTATTTQEGVSIMKLGSKSSVLMVDSLKSSHSGNYTCRASNSAGTDEYSATLVVNGD